MKNIYIAALLSIASGFSLSAQAHMLWLEQANDQSTRAYFGEYSDNITETQDGPLKAFINAKATQENKQYPAVVHQNHLEYTTKGSADVRVNNDLLHGDMLAQFRAKAGRQSTEAISELEIMPTKANSNQFVVIFQGKPLAKQEVRIFAPNRWSKTYHTNDKGEFSVETPWTGRYVIEAGKPVQEAGEYKKQAYKMRYLVATLSFNVE